jgi:hypothetical protein
MHPECAPLVVWRYTPHGLVLTKDSEDLGKFVYLDDANRNFAWDDPAVRAPRPRPGPAGKKTAGTIIVDGDSVIKKFYCYKGAWLVQVLD